jgi:hypothetical protein
MMLDGSCNALEFHEIGSLEEAKSLPLIEALSTTPADEMTGMVSHLEKAAAAPSEKEQFEIIERDQQTTQCRWQIVSSASM